MGELIPYLLGTGAFAFALLVYAVAFFVMMYINDVKQHSIDIADLKGKNIAHVQTVDIKIDNLAASTLMQIQQVNKNVGDLTELVKTVFEHAVNK